MKIFLVFSSQNTINKKMFELSRSNQEITDNNGGEVTQRKLINPGSLPP